MKRLCKISFPAIVLLIALAMLATQVLAATAFEGVWKSIDSDGSLQKLVIKPMGGKYAFQYFDKGASVCGVDESGNPLYPALGQGVGAVHGNTFKGVMKLFCLGPETWFVGKFEFIADYQPETDSLLDVWGITWTRVK